MNQKPIIWLILTFAMAGFALLYFAQNAVEDRDLESHEAEERTERTISVHEDSGEAKIERKTKKSDNEPSKAHDDSQQNIVLQIVDPNGSPLAGAEIRHLRHTEETRPKLILLKGAKALRSDAEGKVLISQGEGIFLSCIVTHSDHPSLIQTLDTSVQNRFELRMMKGGSVRGWVKEHYNYEGISGVILFFSRNRDEVSIDDFSVKSDTSGHLNGPIVASGNYELTVKSDRHIAKEVQTVVVDVDNTTPIEIFLERGPSFRGRVTDVEGRPLVNFKFRLKKRLVKHINANDAGRILVSDHEGYFNFYGISKSEHYLSLSADGYLDIERTLYRTRELVPFKFKRAARLVIEATRSIDGKTTRITDTTPLGIKKDPETDVRNFHPLWDETKKLFHCEKLKAGEFDLEFTCQGMRNLKRHIRLHSGETTKLKLNFTKAHRIKVKINGVPDIVDRDIEIVTFNRKHEITTRHREIDENGSFVSCDIEEPCVFVVNINGYVSSKLQAVKNFEQESSSYEVTFTRGLTLDGNITDDAGAFIEGVQVSATLDQVHLESSRSFSVKSDKDGKFSIVGLSKGNLEIHFAHKGYISSSLTVEIKDHGNKPLSMVLTRESQIQGRVVDHRGDTVENAKLKIYRYDEKSGDQRYKVNEAISDSEGKFTFDALTVDTYNIHAHKSGVGISTKNKVVFKAEGDHKEITIKLEKGLSISGKLIDDKRRPIPGISMSFGYFTAGGGPDFSNENTIISKENGDFLVENLRPGSYMVGLNHDTYILKSGEFTIVKAGDRNIVLTTIKKTKLRGRVLLPNGELAQDYTLSIRWQSSRSWDRNLNFEKISKGFSSVLEQPMNIRAERFRLVAKSDGYSPGISSVFDLESEITSPIEIRLSENLIQEFRTVHESGKEISGVDLSWLVVGKEDGNSGRGVESGLGMYTVESLPQENIEFIFLSNTNQFAGQSVTLDMRSPPGRQTVTFLEGGHLRGRVLHPKRGVGVKAKVSLVALEGQHLSKDQRGVMSNKEGLYRVRHLPPGKYQVGLELEHNRDTMNGKDVVNTKEVLIVNKVESALDLVSEDSAEYGSIEGSFKNPKDAHLFHAAILINTEGSKKKAVRQAEMKSREFSIEKVKAGKYTLTLIGISGKINRISVQLKRGEKKNVIIELPTASLKVRVFDPDGEPLGEGSGILLPENVNLYGNMQDVFSNFEATSVFRQGDLEISGIRAGKYQLLIRDGHLFTGAGEFKPRFVSGIAIRDGESLKLDDIHMSTGRQISGIVRNGDGDPISGATFLVIENRRVLSFSGFEGKRSAGDGSFKFKGCPNEPFQLVVSAKGYAWTRVTVTSSEPLIILRPGSSVRVNLKGKGIQGRDIELRDAGRRVLVIPTNNPDPSKDEPSSVTNAQGEITIPDVPPGTYTIKVYPKPPYPATHSAPFKVSLDQPTDLTIQVK